MMLFNSRLPPLWILNVFSICFCAAAFADEEATTESERPAVEKLANGDIEWDSLGFHGGPRLTGANAESVWKAGVSQSPALLKRLEDDEAFEAAHVLLTSLWRVSQRKKNSFSHALSDGFFVCHNGLFVRITWRFEAGKEKKTVEIPDLPCQRKRIREFWLARYRDHPEEFSPDDLRQVPPKPSAPGK